MNHDTIAKQILNRTKAVPLAQGVVVKRCAAPKQEVIHCAAPKQEHVMAVAPDNLGAAFFDSIFS